MADATVCSADEQKKATDCVAKIATVTSADYDKVCTYYKDTYACYPPCYCNDDNYKAARDLMEKSAADGLKAIDSSKTCTLKCGSAAGLRAGAVTTLLVAAFALLAGH